MTMTNINNIAIIPQPRRIRTTAGTCSVAARVLRVHPGDALRPACKAITKALGLRLAADPKLPAHAACVGAASLPAAPAKAQGYGLRITPTGIAVQGHDDRGLVWGLQTLRQILAQSSRPPCLEIADWPEYGIRYHHDDVSRKQVSTLADFRRIIRHLGAFKFSHYTLYLEDMVLVDGLPLMGENRGAFTVADLRALVAEGERWQVELFPTLSLAGHQENLLRLPRYRPMGARTWQPPSSFDPRHPDVRQHLSRLLDAVCPAFPSPLFHMGFDEVIGLDKAGFLEHINWCCAQLVARGKTPLFWADMLYNHFGGDLLRRLHPAVVPVVWNYSTTGGRARAALSKMLRDRDQAWVLAGYNNWGSFFHAPLAEAQTQWRNWRRIAPPGHVAGFGASQWGDDGYENSRDLAWPLFAAFAEQAWTGNAGQPATVETRFHNSFHGHPLPELTRLRRLLENGFAVAPRRAWQLHRLPAPGWVRLAHAGQLPGTAQLDRAVRQVAEARRLLARCRKLARTERGHLDHYEVAIDRLASVVARARAARQPVHIPAALAALAKARRTYRRSWLAHNRPENIEVSLAVFDAQRESWRALTAPAPRRWVGWQPLDLGRAWNSHSDGIAGLPIGLTMVGDVPFHFPPVNRTHAELATGQTLRLALNPVPLRDLHLVVSQSREGEVIRPAARLRLTRRGHVVYEEDLLAIRHLCDWWAPLGEHMWAGGGLAYVDPVRVRYLLSPNPPYGLTCLYRFPWPAAPVADRLELTCLGDKPLQVCAITAQEARR